MSNSDLALLLGCSTLLFALGFTIQWVKKRRDAIASSWPSANGQIQSVELIGGGRRGFGAVLHYSYFVGEYRSGSCCRQFVRESPAEDFMRRMKDKHVLIRYKVTTPEVSILEESVIEQALLSDAASG
jgi:hypothetical protein